MRRALSQQAAPNADHFPKGSCVVMRICLLIVYNEITIKSSKTVRFWRNEAKFINTINDRPCESRSKCPWPSA